jgi:hypothetical protein
VHFADVNQDVCLGVDPKIRLLPHPWRLCLMAGPLCHRMISEFHAFLCTVSVILRSPTVAGNLQRLCYRAWTIQLTVHEQDLLMLTCNILSTVAQTLADSGVPAEWPAADVTVENRVEVVRMTDVGALCRVEASSRQQMVACLLDGSAETFWESGEADKNRPRTLFLTWQPSDVDVQLVCVYVDNRKDEAYRIQSVTVHTGDDLATPIGSHQLQVKFSGWLKYAVRPSVCKLQVKAELVYLFELYGIV